MLTVIDAAAIFRNISNLCPQGICHLSQNAFFPLRRMIGGMWATELDFLPRPGGLSAPMLRLEWAYFFRSTMLHMDMTNFTLNLEDHDDQRIAASVDFAVPIRFLNPSQMFNISAQYTLRRIAGISDGFENGLVSTEGPVNKYNHMTSLMVTTNYLTSQLTPVVIWNQDWINHSYTFKAQASYTFTSAITFIAGITLFEGSLTGRGVEPYDHKDYASFKVQYKFN